MFKTFGLELDVLNRSLNDVFIVNSNDLNTVKLDVIIKEGEIRFDLTGKTVRLAVKKPDGLIVFQDGALIDAEEGRCEFVLTSQTILVTGKHESELMIYEGSNKVAVTTKFYYQVERAILNDNAVLSTNEFQAINKLIGNGTGIDTGAREQITGITTALGGKASVQSVTTLTSQLSETVKEVNGAKPVNGKITIPIPEVDTSKLATKTELSNVLDGSPKGTYATLALLQAAFPIGTPGVYIVTADGHIYSWSGSAWTDRGLYQAVGIAPNSVTINNMDSAFQTDYYSKTGLPIANIMNNGEFSNGATGWAVLGGTLSVVNKLATVTGNGSYAFARISQGKTMVIGKKYLLKTKAKVMDGSCLNLQLTVFDGTKTYVIAQKSNPIVNTDYVLSGSITLDSITGTPQIMVVANYIDAATVTNKQLVIQSVITIDLTETYGEGQEIVAQSELTTKLSVKAELKDVGLPIINSVTNGDFSNGTTKWNTMGGVLSIANKVATVTGDGAYNIVRLSQTLPITVNKKYFVKSRAKVVGDSCLSLQLTWYNGVTTQIVATILNPVAGTEYLLSGNIVSGGTSTNSIIVVVANYSSNAIAIGKQIVVQNVNAIDLTETYGEGQEPVTSTKLTETLATKANAQDLTTLEASIKQDFGFPATNLIANGNFNNGTTGWSASKSVNTVTGNVLRNTADGTAVSAFVKTKNTIGFTVGDIMYYKTKVRVTNSSCLLIQVNPSSDYGGYGGVKTVPNPVVNKYYDLSNVYTTLAPSTPNTVLNFPIEHYYANAANASGKVLEVQNVLAINLTKTFGSGSEPSLVEMDMIINKFPNGWFDGTVAQLLSTKDLYQNTLDRTNFRPTGTYSTLLEHEYRTTETSRRVNPKIFAMDSKFDIYSSEDYGKKWNHEASLGSRFGLQVSNVNKRMLLKHPSATTARDGALRIYTSDYKLISEKTGIHGCYGTDSMDGKPGDDDTFVFAEYLQGGDSVNGVNIYQTENSGKDWTSFNLMDITHFHSVRFDPFNPTHVYASTGDARDNFRNRWYKSIDSGKNFTLIGGGTIGEGVNLGQTRLVDGSWTFDKYMRSTNTVMGVDSGIKGRNSIFFFDDNIPCSFVRFDKTTHRFQLIFTDLPGCAYGAVLTKDGIFTFVEEPESEYDTLYYVKFPILDDDLDKPEKYELFTLRMPRTGHYMRQIWSRQQDIAGGILVGNSNAGHIGQNLMGERNNLGTKVNLSWTSEQLEVANLTIKKPVIASGTVSVAINGIRTLIAVSTGDTAIQVADKIREKTFTGYTTGGNVGTSTVTFKSITPGTELLVAYSAWSTGAEAVLKDAKIRLVANMEPIMTI